MQGDTISEKKNQKQKNPTKHSKDSNLFTICGMTQINR